MVKKVFERCHMLDSYLHTPIVAKTSFGRRSIDRVLNRRWMDKEAAALWAECRSDSTLGFSMGTTEFVMTTGFTGILQSMVANKKNHRRSLALAT